LNQVKTCENPFYIFLSGGAGVGKTVVVRTIYQALIRWYNSKPGSNPDDTKVLLSAPTGKAAYLIKGNTLHSIFAIPANQGFSYTPLASDKLNTLRSKFCQLKFLIIDEVSMVGNHMFSFINQRLQQIMGSSQVFGGVSILTVGDLYQLKPVFDGWIFANLHDDYGPLATNLWRENFTMYELTKIMRQRDSKEFAELLNRLRENKQTKADIELLEKRTIETDIIDPSYPIQVPHIYLTRKMVETHNMLVCDNQGAKKISNQSFDVVLGDVTPEVKQRILLKIPNDTSKTMNLSSKVETALGLRNELSCNVDIEDGMANGAPCILTAVGPIDNTGRYKHMWVQFENENMGSKCRLENKTLYTKFINPKWTPLFRVKRLFSAGKYKSAKVMRDQFPIRCAAAKTCHRCQGDTMECLVVDFSGKTFPHAHYVGLSRVTQLENLSIRHLNIKNIAVDKFVGTEMKRLRSSPLLISDPLNNSNNTFNILYQNVRSLRKHFPDILSCEHYNNTNINIFSETKLTDKDVTNQYNMTDFYMYRCDSPKNRAYGLMVYSKNKFNNNTIHKYTLHNFSYIETVLMDAQTGLPDIPVISVAGLYVSPKTTKEDLKLHLHEIIDVLKEKRQPYVVIGDMNINLLNIQDHFIMDILQCTQIIKEVTTDYISLLDHIISRDLQSLKYKSGVVESYFSDHKAVYISLEKSSVTKC
jgi:exonuclease III